MVTVGRILENISALRSKIALLESLVGHVNSNYVTNDAEDQYTVYRSDGAMVSQDHIEQFLSDLKEQQTELEAQLHHWESLTVRTGDEEEAPDKPAKKTLRQLGKGRKLKGKLNENRSKGSDHAASGEDDNA